MSIHCHYTIAIMIYLKLINCEMVDTDLAFEKSEVEAVITTKVDSIKNPLSGQIQVPELGKLIMDDPDAKGQVLVIGQKSQDDSRESGIGAGL